MKASVTPLVFVALFSLVVARSPFVSKFREHELKERMAAGAQGSKDLWFVQELDHFNFQDTRQWKQRYFLNDSFYNPDLGGPIFFQIGGEAGISSAYVDDAPGLIYIDWAQQEGALLVALEHRFYGASQPLSDLSTKNLRYLNSQQALADAANFITAIQAQYPKSGPIISFGGSYPGALSAWFRFKYPHITSASIASSAPVFAVLDMISYLDVVDESLDKIGGVACDANVRLATKALQALLATSSGQQQVQQMFQLCEAPSDWRDQANFMSDIVGNFMGTAQYNGQIPGQPTVSQLCQIMEDESVGTPLQRYIKINSLFFQPTPQVPCLDISYSTMIAQLQNVTADPKGVGGRQWTYQTCAEFGYFQSTDSDSQPFGDLIPLEFYTDICSDVYGFTDLPRINETNIIYGGKQPGGDRVCFVNGSVDPWHSLSIINSSNPNMPAVYIPGTSHCQDMGPARAGDPPALAPAQQQIYNILHQWIEDSK